MEFKDISKEIAEVSQGYNFHKPPELLVTLQDLAAKAWRWVSDWLDTIFRVRRVGSADSRTMSDLMQLSVLVACVLCVGVLVFYLWRRLHQQREAAKLARAGSVEIEELLDSSGWKKQAAKLAEKEDYKSACRALYLSLLQLMDEQAVAEFAPTKTNYEYSYSLAGKPQIQQAFKKVANSVEEIWFGNKQALSEDYLELAASLGDIQPEIEKVGATKRLELEKLGG